MNSHGSYNFPAELINPSQKTGGDVTFFLRVIQLKRSEFISHILYLIEIEKTSTDDITVPIKYFQIIDT